MNGIPTTRYNDPVLCEAETTLTLTSIASVDIHYWTIIAYIDTEMYRVESGVDKSVTLPGRDKHEYALFSFYVCLDRVVMLTCRLVRMTSMVDLWMLSMSLSAMMHSLQPKSERRDLQS